MVISNTSLYCRISLERKTVIGKTDLCCWISLERKMVIGKTDLCCWISLERKMVIGKTDLFCWISLELQIYTMVNVKEGQNVFVKESTLKILDDDFIHCQKTQIICVSFIFQIYHNVKIQNDKYKEYLLLYLFLDNKNGWILKALPRMGTRLTRLQWSLAYYCFAIKRNSATQVLPITVLCSQMSIKQKSATHNIIIPITVLRSSEIQQHKSCLLTFCVCKWAKSEMAATKSCLLLFFFLAVS